jgi:hypothetical protein
MLRTEPDCIACDDFATQGVPYDGRTYWLCRDCVGIFVAREKRVGRAETLRQWGLL